MTPSDLDYSFELGILLAGQWTLRLSLELDILMYFSDIQFYLENIWPVSGINIGCPP